MRLALTVVSSIGAALLMGGCFVDRGGTRDDEEDSGTADAAGVDGGGVDAADRDSTIGCGADTGWICTAGERSRCLAGAVERNLCVLGCSTLTPAECGQPRASNVDIDHENERDVSIDATVTVDTTDCRSDPAQSWELMSIGGFCVARVRVLSVGSSGFIDVTGTLPFLILAADEISIAGTLDASAFGTIPGPGGRSSGDPESGGDGADGSHASGFAVPADSGGAGASMCGRGGFGGGASTWGTIPRNPSREPFAGPSYTGEPLSGGFSGGNGHADDRVRGSGGGGGGGVQLSAGRLITITGRVTAAGGGGSGGGQDFRASTVGSGAGGGSGGTILIEAPTVDVSGALWAPGGGGGSTAFPWSDGDPGSSGSSGETRPPGGNNGLLGRGGGGGGGPDPDADNGADSPGYPYNGGGGGGSAGCIIVRDRGAVLGALASSPSLGTSAVRVLELRIE